MIVVFDSGVWISAFHFGGTPLAALDAAVGQTTIAICSPILTEIRSTLTMKFRWQQARVDRSLAQYALDTTFIQTTGSLTGICRDPKDDMVFECAVLAGASAIISGDKDLLTVKVYNGIRVLTPREFLHLHGSQSLVP